ncbi:metal transporter CNNM4 [Candidatus Magnetobacterium bavaricum]|uniref:Metal transporter CNNM4 n=1 Tax=Candidatus Magnetobacterium bavaricum TaxID=29290 RepID=A0A0F3H4B5_9BACT|nr:metal transporter CNNM4 [Candidatus Magnetobacterium bavaricum]
MWPPFEYRRFPALISKMPIITRYPLKVGGRSIGIVKVFMFLFYPVAYPLSRVLDRALGAEMPTVWSKQELKEIIKFHEDRPESSVDANEERIILGALSYSDKIAADIMTPRSVLFSLEANATLDDATLSEIKTNGFTRIPVYRDQLDNIIGLLYAKDLIAIEPGAKVSDIYRQNKVLIIPGTKKLGTLMNDLLQGRNHLAVVYDEYGMLVGIVTLEDIVEEIMKVEIVDEADNVVDLRLEANKRAQKYLHRQIS